MSMKLILNILFILVNCFSLSAQEFNFDFEPDSIPVEMEGGWIPHVPWAGGESQSMPELCDIDNEGDLNLLMDKIWQIDYLNLRFYRNIMIPENAI